MKSNVCLVHQDRVVYIYLCTYTVQVTSSEFIKTKKEEVPTLYVSLPSTRVSTLYQ